MAIISSPITFSSGEIITASDHNTNYGNIYTEFNGNIDNGNIKALAGIVDTKLAQITTAAKVNVSAITGILPTANMNTSNLFQTGMIILWSGATTAIPSGWILCNGTSGTPNLTDRFVVGAGSTYAVADTGGATTVTLTVAQIPAHTHNVSGYINESAGTGIAINWTGTARSVDSASAGGGTSHQNMPPYYALCYIYKV